MQLCNPNIIELLINHFSPRRITVKRVTMTLDLNQILARDDYKRLTESLKEKVFEVAKSIRRKMDELDVSGDYCDGGLSAEGVNVVIAHLGYGDSGYYDCLVMESRNEDFGFPVWHCLEDVGTVRQEDRGYFVDGEATNKERLAFLNASKKLIIKLGEIEQENVEIVQNALDNK